MNRRNMGDMDYALETSDDEMATVMIIIINIIIIIIIIIMLYNTGSGKRELKNKKGEVHA